MTTEEKIDSVTNELNSEFDRLEKVYIDRFKEMDAGDNYITAMKRNAQICQEFTSEQSDKLLSLTQDLICKYPIDGIDQKLMEIFENKFASILNTLMGLD